MKRFGACAAVLLVLVGGCGRSEDPEPTAPTTSTAAPTTAAPTTPAPTTPAPPTSANELVIAPGALGPATVGMTKAEAVATGLFDADVTGDGEGCVASIPLQWKPAFGDAVDVLTDDADTIVSMGVWEAGPTTDEGIGVTSSYDELAGAYGDRVTAPAEAGYGQTGVFLQDGEDWIGFLFDTTPDTLAGDGSKPITFIEVTRGEKPSVIRDGC